MKDLTYEIWKEPGRCGRVYYVFYGLKTTEDMETATRLTAKELKTSVSKLDIHMASVKGGKELWIGGYIGGAKKATAFTRKRG